MLRRTRVWKYLNGKVMSTLTNGTPFEVLDRAGYSVLASWTSTSGPVAGTLKLQASNDYDPTVNPVAGGTWTDITGSSVVVAGDGSNGWNVSDVFYAWARIVYTASAGDGVISATACVKD